MTKEQLKKIKVDLSDGLVVVACLPGDRRCVVRQIIRGKALDTNYGHIFAIDGFCSFYNARDAYRFLTGNMAAAAECKANLSAAK